MVLTRSRSKRNKTNTATTSTANTSLTAVTAQNDQTAATNMNNEEDEEEKSLENLKLVASLVDWSSYDALAGKIFYQKFGRTLERKVEEYEQAKNSLKGMVREACGNIKALQTPKKMKPAAALREQMERIRALNFDTDEEDNNQEDQVEETVTMVPATPDNQNNNTVHTALVPVPAIPDNQNSKTMDPALAPATPDNQNSKTMDTALAPATPDNAMDTAVPMTPSLVLSTPQTPMVKKPKLGTPCFNPKLPPPLPSSSSMKKLAITQSSQKKALPPIHMPPLFGGRGTPAKETLNTTIQKKAKLKEIDEKVEQAKKAREEQLKEKAERAKREAEERRKRVEAKKKQQEEERQQKETRAREQQEIVRKFVAEQKKQHQKAAAHPPTSPFRQVAPPPPSAPKKQLATNSGTKPAAAEKQKSPPPKSTLRSPQLSPILEDNDDGIVDVVEEDEPLEEVSAYDLTKDKILQPSTKENYNVDDLSSGDETDNDNDEQPKKTVPQWAQKENIVRRIQAIRRLVPGERIERHFGRIRQPTVQEFFAGYNKNYPQRRQSSATWNSPMSDPTPGVGRFHLINKKE